jgi:cytochrome c oxidase subunit 2
MMKILTISATLVSFALGSLAPALANDVNVVANGQTFAFAPSVVTLHKGKPTTLHFKATPGAPHGLNVPALGISNAIITQAGTNVTVTPMKTGTYVAHCTLVCGTGHAHMAMKFIVK